MSKPIETLEKEHRLIEKVLASLGTFLQSISGESAKERETLRQYAEFFRVLADRCHHGKEEKLLFEALKKHGMPSEFGPLAVMMQEHEIGRSLVRELGSLSAGDGQLRAEELTRARTAGAEFISLLRAHIQKENNVLFPAADRMLSSDAVAELEGQFDSFERHEMGEGVHENMHRLAEGLIASYPSGSRQAGS
jgi:hemerythrin-like domain-containing protein